MIKSLTSGLLLYAIAAFGVTGCKDSALSGPTPQSVDPASAPAGKEVPITIGGVNFNPLIVADYDDQTKSKVNGIFFARLGSHALIRVEFKNPLKILAVVPATLAPGSYPLTVVDPRGQKGLLENAFLVVDRGDGGPDASTKDGAVDAPGDAVFDSPAKGDAVEDGAPRVDQKLIEEAGKPDAPPVDLGGCPAVCTNGCTAGVCRLNCQNGCTCPAGMVCDTTCSGKNSCQQTIDCRKAKRCDITCSGEDACRNIDCRGSTECNIKCTAEETCRTVNCAGAKRCIVDCSSKEACKQKLVCNGGFCDIDCRATQACQAGVDCSGACGCIIRGSGFPKTCPSACSSGCGAINSCNSCP